VVTNLRKMLSRTVCVVLVAWIVCVAAVGTAIAGPFEDGVAAYRRGDYTEAAKFYRKAAEQGNATAQVLLGGMYKMGRGVIEDDTEAAKWYRKAAEQDDVSAQNDLAHMYSEGRGVTDLPPPEVVQHL
jgi:uncharacterized protein